MHPSKGGDQDSNTLHKEDATIEKLEAYHKLAFQNDQRVQREGWMQTRWF